MMEAIIAIELGIILVSMIAVLVISYVILDICKEEICQKQDD